MVISETAIFERELRQRKSYLEAMPADRSEAAAIQALLREVDAAILRLGDGTFGICEECHDPIENERLLADPSTRFCIDHLTLQERRAFEEDIETARRVQQALLPTAGRYKSWEIAFAYTPSGVVSGDYCDIVARDSEGTRMLVLLGDVAGKGVGASLLMSHLHAMFRSLSAQGGGLCQIVEQANNLLCQSTQQSHYATLACLETTPAGDVNICNAGHCSPLVITAEGTAAIEATGLPLGLFRGGSFLSTAVQLGPGDVLLLYSDGLIESENPDGEEYGVARLRVDVEHSRGLNSAQDVVHLCMTNLSRHLNGAKPSDDLTVIAVRRAD
jgi:sigma-B regulation protein RsbU (phosphoserine phosphatase)